MTLLEKEENAYCEKCDREISPDYVKKSVYDWDVSNVVRTECPICGGYVGSVARSEFEDI